MAVGRLVERDSVELLARQSVRAPNPTQSRPAKRNVSRTCSFGAGKQINQQASSD